MDGGAFALYCPPAFATTTEVPDSAAITRIGQHQEQAF
jgi:hypothetical protein